MNTLKLACADFTFPLLKHEKVLDLITLLEVEGVDVGLFSGRSHLRPETEFASIKKQSGKLRQQLEDRGLRATDVYLQLSNDLGKFTINHPDADTRKFARESFLKLLDYSTELQADHVTILPGMAFSGEPVSESLKRSYEELAWRVEMAKGTGIAFGIEPHIGSPFEHPSEAEALINAVPGLTLTLDYTHFIRNGHSQETVTPLLKYASHFHARGARKDRLQVSMTENIIDYDKIVNDLVQVGYKGWLGLEYIWIEWEGCNQVDTLSETIRLRDVIKAAVSKHKSQTKHNEN